MSNPTEGSDPSSHAEGDGPPRAAAHHPPAEEDSLLSRRPWLAPLLVFVVALGFHANTLGNGFTWDDDWLIVNNERIQDWDYVRYMLVERDLWRTVKRTSLLLDAKLWGLDRPFGFHLTNLLLHGLACLSLLALARRLGLGRLGALACALVFAVHPLHVEAVANISHRKEMLALLFCCLSFLAWLRARDATPPRTFLTLFRETRGTRANLARLECVAASAFLYLLAMLSKEAAAVLLPALIGLHEFLRAKTRPNELGPSQGGGRLLAGVATLLVGAVLVLFTFRGYLSELPRRWQPENIDWMTLGQSSELGVVPLISLKAFATYAGLLLAPLDLHAARSMVIPSGWADVGVLCGLGLLAAGLAALAYAYRHRQPPLFLGLAWYGLMLLPSLNVIPLTHWLVAERFVYVPSAGLALVLGWSFEGLMSRAPAGYLGRLVGVARSKLLLLSLLAGLVLVYGLMSQRQNRVWKDDQTLWEHTLSCDENSYMALDAVAAARLREGALSEAEALYRRALEVNPRYFEPHYGLARTLYQQGRFEDCIEAAKTHAHRAHVDTKLLVVLGSAHFALKQWDEGLAAYDAATAREPDAPGLRLNHATVLNHLNRAVEALDRLGPPALGDDETLVLLRAKILYRLRRFDESRAELDRISAQSSLAAEVERYRAAMR